jgi:hypothetical protein
VPHITTLHGRLDLPELAFLYRHFSDMPLVSISDAQRAPVPWANWLATVYHGVPERLYGFHERPGSYLAFIGERLNREDCRKATETLFSDSRMAMDYLSQYARLQTKGLFACTSNAAVR